MKVRFTSDDDSSAYIQLEGHPGPGIAGSVHRSIPLSHLIPDYTGPSIVIDLDVDGRAIGVEILE